MLRILILIVSLAAFFPAYGAEACTSATPACTDWINLDNQARALVYRTYPLDKKNSKITRALIVVHDAGRDADNYFRTALSAAFLSGASSYTISTSPPVTPNTRPSSHHNRTLNATT